MENQKTDKNNNGENTGTVKNENQNFLKVYVYNNIEFIWLDDHEYYKDDFSEYWSLNVLAVTSEEENNLVEGKYSRFIGFYLPEKWVYYEKGEYYHKRSRFLIAEIENAVKARLVLKPEQDYLHIGYCLHELKNKDERRKFKKIMQMFPKKSNMYYFIKNIQEIPLDTDVDLSIFQEETVIKIYFEDDTDIRKEKEDETDIGDIDEKSEEERKELIRNLAKVFK